MRDIITYEYLCHRLTNLGLVDFDAIEQPMQYDGGTTDMMVDTLTREINAKIKDVVAAVTAERDALKAWAESADEYLADDAHPMDGGSQESLELRRELRALRQQFINQRNYDAAKGGAK